MWCIWDDQRFFLNGKYANNSIGSRYKINCNSLCETNKLWFKSLPFWKWRVRRTNHLPPTEKYVIYSGSNNRNSLLDFDPLSVRRTCAPLMMGRASVWSERKLSLKSFHSTYPWSEWTIILVWNLKSLETSFIFSFIFTHLKLCSFDHWFDELKGIL